MFSLPELLAAVLLQPRLPTWTVGVGCPTAEVQAQRGFLPEKPGGDQ